MKKIVFVLLAVVMMLSCTKAPINGDLEGLWQLTRIETPYDTVNTREYWSFQLHLIQLGSGQFYGRFDHSGGELRIYDMVIGEGYNPSGVDKDGEVECLVADSTLKLMKPFGLYRLDTKFKVESLSYSHMRLRSEDACLHFRKY